MQQKIFSFFVPGKPRGKERPRVTGYVTYTPIKTREYEKLIQDCFYNNYPTFSPFEKDEPLVVGITAYFNPAKRLLTRANKQKIAGGGLYPTKKPDCDNIAKIVMDGLNGVVYYDDKQIVDCFIKKYYILDGNEGVHIVITNKGELNAKD